jgi:hypothetical protein
MVYCQMVYCITVYIKAYCIIINSLLYL